MSTAVTTLDPQAVDQAHHFQMYRRFPITLSHGRGALVYDTDGKEYVDALAGIAVNTLGHAHPRLVHAIQTQVTKLMHVSNLYYTEPLSKLGERLTGVAQMDRVFFCNSGAEANEGAIKLARKVGTSKGKAGHIISFGKAFHGRTIGTIALGQEKYQKGFGPMPDEARIATINDIESVKALIDTDTVACIIEPIQGEGGVLTPTADFLQELRQLCDQHDMLLIFDEVQCGVGRTGSWYAWQHYGVQPDILTSAKGLGGGFPIGAVLATQAVADHLGPGNHGTTYGGNPLACAAALAVIEAIEEEGLLRAAEEKGNYLKEKLQELQSRFPEDITEVRGVGLMLGAQLAYPCRPIALRMMEAGVLVSATAEYTIRMVPPLVISFAEIDRTIQAFEDALLAEKTQA